MSNELDPEAQLASPCFLRVEGYCLRCVDCAMCGYMQAELKKHPPDTQAWVCATCAGRLAGEAKQQNIGNVLMGYYTEGVCLYCHRESRMLQLVLGPIYQMFHELQKKEM